MYTCDICLKEYSRRDNLQRHKNSTHTKVNHENESDSYDSESTMDDYSGDDDHDSSESRNEHDPWSDVIDEVFTKCQGQFEEQVMKMIERNSINEAEARDQVYEDMRKTYRVAIMNVLCDKILWFNAMGRQPVYKAIQKTAKNLMDVEDFDAEEAWRSAIDKRQYLLDSVLKDFNPPDLDTEYPTQEDESMPVLIKRH